MTNGLKLKNEICRKIMEYTDDELYELLTGDNPFQMRICEICVENFGECPETLDGDDLCVERFVQWCEIKK